MTEAALRIAVVGHTNTGKTSLLRTLTRNPDFGEVADQPGTTRHVEGARLAIDNAAAIEWFDTPGMEDSIALLEYLERLQAPGERLDGPARVRRFLESPEAHRRFEQEARVLRKLLECDAGLYVIDARDPVLGKHRDELAILASCARPLLPVLNFVNAPEHRADQWREAMARLGLHAVLEFDTVAPPLDGEAQLYARLAALLDRHAAMLQRLAQALAQQREQRRQAACVLVADLLVDVAALHVSSPGDEAALQEAAATLREQVRRREQACVDALLALYNFHRDDYDGAELPLQGERWGMDLFHPQALKDMGVQLGVGMAAGGLWQGVERLGKRVAGKLRGYRELSVDDPIVRLLALRQRQLIHALERRGHAARTPVQLQRPDDRAWQSGPLPDGLKEARSRPEWSALGDRYQEDERRKRVVAQLARQLAQAGDA